ncbi:hypothetical protein H7I53_00425 [Mycolicibacterium pulveris]|uniref:Uncharacterized protein n=1 Tax=Mycolicibacterium pulveris TaxID=36813 RepID=A0A7I7UHF5_MYCPV|nr:hypothetical protein [Mycolicibacterium pulveris]MCV6978696.1 hypothetical protein [Mycolicibacterium pulveris]BBY80109.1 hypothetical protein MPUL_12670 [Mycolicibacterium pulveris]
MPPPTDHDIRKLIVSYAIACSALLTVLVLVVIYGVFINETAFVAPDHPETNTPTGEIVTSGWITLPSS